MKISGITGVLFLCAVSPAMAASSLCDGATEQVIFSCKVKRGAKMVSVCASKLLSDKAGYVQYRFGVPGKVELEFPADRKGSQKLFSYAHYFRFQVDRSQLSFENGGYAYAIYDDYEGDSGPPTTSVGLTVTAPGGKEQNLPCAAPVTNHLGKLESVVACDGETFGMGCPTP